VSDLDPYFEAASADTRQLNLEASLGATNMYRMQIGERVPKMPTPAELPKPHGT